MLTKISSDYFWREKWDRVHVEGDITINLHNSLVFEMFLIGIKILTNINFFLIKIYQGDNG